MGLKTPSYQESDNWGRVGTHGQMRLDTFNTAADAHATMSHLRNKKGRRGYLVRL